MRRHLPHILVATALAIPSGAAAQEAPAGRAMLVLDGSGSMWGQIGGRPKIEIAREAVDRMLADWPDGREIGLMAYGHRRESDCGDIEMLAAPGPLDRAALTDAMAGIEPLGKTPIGASVEAAAEAMADADMPASVIVVTDGLETCGADLCALGERLAESGAALTAHVIGFDVEDSEGQLACLAEASGGQYISAANAESLTDALQVASAAEPQPEPESSEPLHVDEFERAELGETWTVQNPAPANFVLDGGALVAMTVQPGHMGEPDQPNVFRWTDAELPEGDWEIRADFTARLGEVQTLGGRRAIVQVGRFLDAETYIAVEIMRQGNSNDDMWLKLVAASGGNVTVEEVEIAGDVRGYDLAQILSDFEAQGARLSVIRRGRDYVGRLETLGWTLQPDGPSVIETVPLSVLRSAGDPALFAGTLGSEQTLVEFSRIEIIGSE